MSKEVSTTKTITRYLINRNEYSNEKATFAAFLPDISVSKIQVSVSVIDDLSEDEIWWQGIEHVARPRNRKLKGRADISVSRFVELALKVFFDEPPPNHAHIENWPEPHPPFKSTSKRQQAIEVWGSQATELARNARMVAVPTRYGADPFTVEPLKAKPV